VLDIASRRNDATYELVDLRDYPPAHSANRFRPSLGQYQNDHRKGGPTRSLPLTDSSS
jgi:hypothetical protein